MFLFNYTVVSARTVVNQNTLVAGWNEKLAEPLLCHDKTWVKFSTSTWQAAGIYASQIRLPLYQQEH